MYLETSNKKNATSIQYSMWCCVKLIPLSPVWVARACYMSLWSWFDENKKQNNEHTKKCASQQLLFFWHMPDLLSEKSGRVFCWWVHFVLTLINLTRIKCVEWHSTRKKQKSQFYTENRHKLLWQLKYSRYAFKINKNNDYVAIQNIMLTVP